MTKHEALGTRSRERHDDRRPSMQLACRRSRLALSRHLVIWGARRIDDWIGSVGSDIIQALIAHGKYVRRRRPLAVLSSKTGVFADALGSAPERVEQRSVRARVQATR